MAATKANCNHVLLCVCMNVLNLPVTFQSHEHKPPKPGYYC